MKLFSLWMTLLAGATLLAACNPSCNKKECAAKRDAFSL